MLNYQDILRLNNLDYSQWQIAANIQSSRDTISAVCKLAEQHGLEWMLSDELSNQTIDIFYPEILKEISEHDVCLTMNTYIRNEHDLESL